MFLKIDLWHPVLFRQHSERRFIQNHVVAPIETVSASVEQKTEYHRVVFAASWKGDPASIFSRKFVSTRALLVSFWTWFS